MLTELVVTAATAGLAIGGLRPPDTRARLFEGIGWAGLGLVLSFVFR